MSPYDRPSGRQNLSSENPVTPEGMIRIGNLQDLGPRLLLILEQLEREHHVGSDPKALGLPLRL